MNLIIYNASLALRMKITFTYANTQFYHRSTT